LTGSAVCVLFADASVAAVGKNDPPEVVADEFAGQALTYLGVPFLAAPSAETSRIMAVTVAGFLIFRVLDIIKPWPIRKLEKLPRGWGILADDLLAGVYSAIGVIAGCKLWMYYNASFDV